MRRGIRGGKWKRPHQNTDDEKPRGLKGREIGLYYRNKQIQQKKANAEQSAVRLEVPDGVLSALQENIRSIEDVARKENIYIKPVEQFNFVKPNTDGADFIPLNAHDSEKLSHHVTNIIPRDDDVLYIPQISSKHSKNEPRFITSDFNYNIPVASSSKVEVKGETDYPTGYRSSITPHDSKFNAKYEIDDVVIVKPAKNETDEIGHPSGNGSTLLPQGSKFNVKDEIDDVIVKPAKNETDDIGYSTGYRSTFNVKDSKFKVKDEIDDIVSVKTDKDETMVISDDSSDVLSVDLDEGASCLVSDLDIKLKPEPHDIILLDDDSDTKSIKSEIKTEECVMASTSCDDVTLLDNEEMPGVQPSRDAIRVSVSNNYGQSSRETGTSHCGEYKYGYDDIITGTFEEKLDESISKGISINMQSETINDLNDVLSEEYKIIVEEEPKYREMKKFRDTLPTVQKTKELLHVIRNNQVVVVSGETGCGKSTQVPQIILDDALKNHRGANVKILVTQPRRIAASSLAMRVAHERAEEMGKSVGYSVRLERVECRPRASIMFCTTGVLLVELEVNQSLSNYSHIILDEVHERDCQIDISMCMLKQVLKKRKDLKLILMSATIDAESLCAYYDNCPLLHIEGLAYPVQDVYLEDILKLTRYQLPPKDTYEQKKPEKPWMMRVARGRMNNAAIEWEKDIQYKAEIRPWLDSIKKTIDPDVFKTLQDRRIEIIDINLILELLLHISKSPPGAILVFLPGISEISKLLRAMKESNKFPDSLYDIHPLHSKLPTLTQHRIFQRPPENIRKIIVATNIAETSITIDDIVYVVDCAKIKYSGLSVDDHVTTLQVEWASKANLRQRRGRAGRCQPGICYHLVTTYRANKLEDRLLPELQRNDLLEPVLQIKRLRLGFAEQALQKMPAVPDQKTIKNAVRHLQQCGALDEKETLTPLGWHMARLPVHPAAGKLLILGALFGCLERAASVAAVWGFKDPFNMVIGKEREVEEAKKTLALGEPSDHVAMSEAIIQWENLEPYYRKSAFAREFFLSSNNLKLLSDMKNQFGQNLKSMGFLKSGNVKSAWENRNSDNLALFKAIVAASLYPNIGTVRWTNLHNNPKKIPSIKVRTPDNQHVAVHPSSVMFTKHFAKHQQRPLCANPGANWLVYWRKQRSSDLFLIDLTLVYTLPLLFFGELNVTQGSNSGQCLIDIMSIKVSCNRETTRLLYQLRSLLDQVLAAKIMVSEGKRSTVFEEQVLNAVKRLITAEDARTDYLDDDDTPSGTDDGYDDCNRRRRWRH